MTSSIPKGPGISLDFDESVLIRLFDLAGPEQSVEILDRLILDLRGAVQVLGRGGRADTALLRRQNHSLVGIAGTVGAHGLHRLAQDVGRDLRDTGKIAPATLAALVAAIEALILRLSEMRAAR